MRTTIADVVAKAERDAERITPKHERHQNSGSGAHQPQSPPSAEGPRITLTPWSEIKLGTARRYLVKNLVPRVGIAVVWGPPKSGKSFWAFDVGLHIALGWKYHGRRVHQGAVVYCAFEGQTGIEARKEAFQQRFLSDHTGEVPFFLEPTALDLVRDHAALIVTIRRQLGATAPVMVVLDTLNRSLRGSESSDQDMAAYINAADAIRAAFQCLVLIVHHCGVDSTRPRGHTSLTGAVEAQLAVKRDAANNVIVTVEWMKDGAEGDIIASALEVVEVGKDEDGEAITSCVVVPSEATHGSQQQRISGPAKVALELLHRALADAGERPPASNHIPDSVTTVVRTKTWRSYCYAGTVTDSDEPDAKRQAFGRVSKKLQEHGHIGTWNDFVWATA